MTAQPPRIDGHDVIHLGGETAVIVPLHEYRILKALKGRAAHGQHDAAKAGVDADHE